MCEQLLVISHKWYAKILKIFLYHRVNLIFLFDGNMILLSINHNPIATSHTIYLTISP